MKRIKLCGLLAAAMIAVTSVASGTEEIIALFTFDDMASRADGTTAVTKDTSVGFIPTLTLAEGGNSSLIDDNGQNGTAFTDADNVSYAQAISASWTSGLTSAPTQNYFVLETSTLGFNDLSFRLDYWSSTGVGPTELALEYAIGEGTFQPLDTLSLTRNSTFHAYTNTLTGTSLENSEKIKIRGTWSDDATSTSARIDNLQLTGHFTNGFNRMALYSFTNSNRYDSINYTDINAETLATVDSHSAGYSTADPDTTSGSPHFSCTQSYAATSRTSYCEIDLTPVSRLLFEPTHLKFYSRPGSSYSSGTIEATVIVNGSEYSMGTNTIGGTMSAYSFHVPESITTPVSSTMKFRIYYYIPGGSSLRLDDVEVIGFDKGYLAQQGDVIALYPITGNSLADTAGNSSVSASDITETNTASFFFNSSSTGSASGPPCIAATGFDGDAQDRYLSFTLSPEYLTAINFNVIQAYMRTGAGPGQIRGEIVDSSGSHSMGTYTISADMTQYIFAVPEDILDSVEETVEIRLYAWDFENSGATFRVDDISVEAVLINLPNPGTIILVQ